MPRRPHPRRPHAPASASASGRATRQNGPARRRGRRCRRQRPTAPAAPSPPPDTHSTSRPSPPSLPPAPDRPSPPPPWGPPPPPAEPSFLLGPLLVANGVADVRRRRDQAKEIMSKQAVKIATKAEEHERFIFKLALGFCWKIHSSSEDPIEGFDPKVLAQTKEASFKLFDDIEDYFELPNSWSVAVRIDVKFPVEPRYHDKQHFIFVDITGSKMEAISHNSDVRRFNTLLQQGSIYTLHGVVFGPNWGQLEFRNIEHRHELTLTRRTTVEPYIMPIQFPPYPKHLMPFHEVIEQPNKTFVVVHLEPLEHIGRRPYREVMLMDSRWNLIVVGVWCDLLNRNALHWELAKANNGIVIGTMLKHNLRHRCMETSDHTTLHFNPIHHTSHRLETIRQLLMRRPNLHFVNIFLEKRWAYLATVIPDRWNL